jgi:proton-translocating NADH-quinone oxidoreductase chain N
MDILNYNNDWVAFLPELFLLTSINLILIYSVIYSTSSFLNLPILASNAIWLILQVLIFVFYLNINNFSFDIIAFNGFIIIDLFGIYIKTFILLSGICVFVMSLDYIKFEVFNFFEFSLLMLLAILGTLLLISSYNLISMYLAIELQSFSSYIISSIKRDSEFSAEAGLKYFILGAFSTGFLLFGCSLIYGFTGSTSYSQISLLLINLNYDNLSNHGIIIGSIFILTAFFFKISSAPFHLWSPDIYEGSPTIVTAFFAIVPKLGLLTLLIRLFFDCLYVLFDYWQLLLFVCSVSSMIVGCLGAIWQIKLKRLLAFSAISHVGFMLIGVYSGSIESLCCLIFYCVIYIILSISTFSLILSIRRNNSLKKVKYVEDVAIILKTNPLLGIYFVITFFSIAGIPPLAGFFSKFFILFDAITNASYVLALIGIITSMISCFYYIRIIQIIYFGQLKQWTTIQKISKEISIVLTTSILLSLLIFVHSELVTTIIYNITINLCI